MQVSLPFEANKKNKDSFSFIEVNKNEIQNKILNLDGNKLSQNLDIPIKIVKYNRDIIRDFFWTAILAKLYETNFSVSRK